VAILGVGLIGGSVARALKKGELCSHIVGYGRSRANLDAAIRLGVVDSIEKSAKAACKGADLVVLATPVETFKPLVTEIASALEPGAIVIDAGSIKGELVREIESMMPSGVRFIGCHPIAGSERSGVHASTDTLFEGALCIITPTGKTDSRALDMVSLLWESFGCMVESMDPDEHDRVYSAVSHFPHLVAYAIVNAASEEVVGSLKYAGSGFKDTTRIAMSPAELWKNICIMNRSNVSGMVGRLIDELKQMKKMLDSADGKGLYEAFNRAAETRREIGD